jgi:hypothetical protein
MEECIKEAKGKQAVLLMGSKPVELFCDVKVMGVQGLVIPSPMLSAKIVMCMANPASVVQGDKPTVGEVRLALEKFIKICKKEKIL